MSWKWGIGTESSYKSSWKIECKINERDRVWTGEQSQGNVCVYMESNLTCNDIERKSPV